MATVKTASWKDQAVDLEDEAPEDDDLDDDDEEDDDDDSLE